MISLPTMPEGKAYKKVEKDARHGCMFGAAAAELYDRCPAPDFAPVLRFIRRVAPGASRAFDMGCGTGSLMHLLSARGMHVEGCDPSAAMVRAARAKNPGATVARAGASDFVPRNRPDLLTATFDVVNHLPSRRAIANFLRRAARALGPGGTLVFDSVTPEDIDRNWHRYVEVDRLPGTILVRSGRRLGPARGTLTYEFFRRRADGAWNLETECHELRSASQEWLVARLADAGFEDPHFVDAVTLRAPDWRTVRWLVAARVPGPVMHQAGPVRNRSRTPRGGRRA